MIRHNEPSRDLQFRWTVKHCCILIVSLVLLHPPVFSSRHHYMRKATFIWNKFDKIGSTFSPSFVFLGHSGNFCSPASWHKVIVNWLVYSTFLRNLSAFPVSLSSTFVLLSTSNQKCNHVVLLAACQVNQDSILLPLDLCHHQQQEEWCIHHHTCSFPCQCNILVSLIHNAAVFSVMIVVSGSFVCPSLSSLVLVFVSDIPIPTLPDPDPNPDSNHNVNQGGMPMPGHPPHMQQQYPPHMSMPGMPG